MNKTPLLPLALSILAAGCSRQPATPRVADGKPDIAIPQALIGPGIANPDDVLISVNGKVLTHGEALRQVDLRLGGPPPANMPQDRVAMIRSQTLSRVIDEFVKRELLLREADARKIAAEEPEIEAALQAIRDRSPEGSNPRGIIESGPDGGDSLRNEVVTAIRIEKLLSQELPPASEPTDEEIEAFAQEHRERLTLPERVRARHILVKSSPDDPPETREQHRALIEAHRQRLIEGADFATLATEVSECPSAARGGDLGVFARGRMAKPFEDAAFSQTPGEIGNVVETPFGLHLILVLDHLQPGIAERAMLSEIVKREKRSRAIADFTRQLQRHANISHSPAVRPPAPADPAQ